MSEDRAKLTSGARGALPDSAFAYVEPGHAVNGKTPDKYRHFPIHDAVHVRNALSRIAQGAKFGDQAKPKVLAAAKKFGIQHDESSDTGRSLESLFPEVRFVADRPEIRSAEAGDPKHIVGYASVFGKVSRRLGGFHEKVMPTAFNASRDAGWPDVVCRYNHKDDMVLGTTGADTLRLEIDERGLKYDVIPPRSREDVVELVERGDVRYSSFAFRVLNPGEDDTWSESEYGLPMRSLHRVQTADVAPVLDPAYNDTTAVARNISGAVESLASWVDGDPAEVRNILEAGQASRFFRRTDRSSTPKVTPSAAAARDEIRVLDDAAVALRRWVYTEQTAPEGDTVVPEEDRSVRSEDEIRAALKNYDQLCQKYTHGEPCIRTDGHTGDHAGLCWGRHNGLPCNQPEGHDGNHTPMTVNARSGEDDDNQEQRSDAKPQEFQGLTAAEAFHRLAQKRKTLTALPEDE